MDHNLLVSELQSLSVETKRRNPEVKDAADQALELLKGGILPRDSLEKHAAELLNPVTLGCKTKVAKTIGISIAALQRLVALGGVPTGSLPEVLQTLSSVANQAVDIQLKILQTLLAILTYHRDAHNEVLGNALLLCFKLHDSRVPVVSSTAAATLRQAVMTIFNRMSSGNDDTPVTLTLPTDPPTEMSISPAAMDAFNLFSDLCLLTAGGGGSSGSSFWGSGEKEKPRLLKLNSLQRTFGLELIESILSGYEEVVKKRPELLFLLQHSLDPLLLKLQAEKPNFPIALRAFRLMFLLIKSFTEQLPAQVEIYLNMLIRLGMGESENGEGAKKDTIPLWLRVLALEILRGICGDPELLQTIWIHYDSYDSTGDSHLFVKLVSALSRLVNEKPALLGVGSQMHGLGVPSHSQEGVNHAGYLDMGIGMMTSAANVGMSTVSSMIGTTGGLGVHSGLKLRLIEQHDKAEAPIIPETYVYLLALQSLNSVAESIYASAAQSPAPASIDGMARSAWPALLAALSYCIGTNLSDALFAEVLSALQDFTIACGLLSLDTPRDAFLNTLGRYAVPPPAVAAMQTHLEAPASRSNGAMSPDGLGLGALGGGGTTHPPSLSERNLICLKSMVIVARLLASSLGTAWYDVLEVLQNANFMLSSRRPMQVRRPTMGSPRIGSPEKPIPEAPRPELFNDIDSESIQVAINTLFDGTRELDDTAVQTFISALCRLSSEMIGLDMVVSVGSHAREPSTPESALSPTATQRRTSGLNVTDSIRSGERSFSLTELGIVCALNLPRLVTRDPGLGWTMVSQHLLAIARHNTAASTIRVQASETLGELLLSAIRISKEAQTQHQVFNVLVRQVDVDPISNTVSVDYEVRSAGYHTLNQILESSGHSLEVGWETIFGILNGVCKEMGALKRSDSQTSLTPSIRPTSQLAKGEANLVRIAFPSLNLICTDFLSALDGAAIRQCIACLGFFGRQREDVNIALAAIGLMWNVSDAVQANSKELWLCLLTEMLELGRDPRLDVRSSAMQSLFRCVELNGSVLSAELWADVLGKIVFPLLDDARGDEGAVLALTSTGSIYSNFLPILLSLPSAETSYQRLLDRVTLAFVTEPRQCCTAALNALEKVLQSTTSLEAAKLPTSTLLQMTWKAFTGMGASLDREEPYTQENLVALVRVAQVLHREHAWTSDDLAQLSTILRSIMTYARSPEYRPDVDVMSPLQTAVAELMGSSTKLSPSQVLSSLAEFSSLAYMGEQGAKLTFVAVAKYAMPKMAEVFGRSKDDLAVFTDGTVEAVIGAYAIPIKLKYDCPPAARYGEDPPLWRTALTSCAVFLEQAVESLDGLWSQIFEDNGDILNSIWAQILEVFSAALLADNTSAIETAEEDESFVLAFLKRVQAAISPRLTTERIPDHERIIGRYASTLRKASTLYHYDVNADGGTTAPAITESSEAMRFWAFDLLLASSVSHPTTKDRGEQYCLSELIQRFEVALRQLVDDGKLRGQMPFPRIREDELLYILRHLCTMRISAGSMSSTFSKSEILAAANRSSSRAHLFYFYPLLLEISFLQANLPRMWLFPSEHAQLFELPETNGENRDEATGKEEKTSEVLDAGDGGDLFEVNARDLTRRCLELVGEELGLTSLARIR